MGKFPNSDLHARYSDFHWNLVKIDPKFKRLYCADIDRLWLEYDFKREAVVAVLDIKRERDLKREESGMTATEKGMYTWFEKNNASVFVVYISRDFQRFLIKPFKENYLYLISDQIKFGEWLLSLRQSNDFLQQFKTFSCNKQIEEHTDMELEKSKENKTRNLFQFIEQ